MTKPLIMPKFLTSVAVNFLLLLYSHFRVCDFVILLIKCRVYFLTVGFGLSPRSCFGKEISTEVIVCQI